MVEKSEAMKSLEGVMGSVDNIMESHKRVTAIAESALLEVERLRVYESACAGIPTEQLEAGCVARLAQAMTTLLEALPEDGEWGHFIDIKDEARAALAPFQKGDRQ